MSPPGGSPDEDCTRIADPEDAAESCPGGTDPGDRGLADTRPAAV
jgi:hypothetical protein